MKEKLSSNEAMEHDSTLLSEIQPLDTTRTERVIQVYNDDDPVRCLQKIFRKHKNKKRRPGVHLIAEKYKHEVNSERMSNFIAEANTFMESGAY